MASNGAEMIAAERQRQIEQKGYTSEHDDGHPREMSRAAACYAVAAYAHPTSIAGGVPRFWPWQDGAWKLSENPIRNLVKAGALIAAEIDRLQRALGDKEDR